MMDARARRLLDRLERACAVIGTQDAADVIHAAQEGRAQLWEGDRLLISTEVVDYPAFRCLRYMTMGGDLSPDDLRDLQIRIDSWGRAQGCTRAETIGRLGWERAPQWTVGWKRLGGYWQKDIRQ